MHKDEANGLILEALEQERSGVRIYEKALTCVVNEDLETEWRQYLAETENHVARLIEVCTELGLDPEQQTPGRSIVRELGAALVTAMETARTSGTAETAEVVACECVVLAETKDHANWDLLGHVSEYLAGSAGRLLGEAFEEVEEQEGEHLFHTKGWCRELWIKRLGMKAVLPPPEEMKDVQTALGAARAEQARGEAR